MKALHLAVFAFGSVSVLACSPAADPIGKGNAHFQITFPDDPDQTCDLTSIGGIGDTPPDLPSGDGEVRDFGGHVTDGEKIGNTGEYNINCKVSKGGKIDIKMEGSNDSPSAPSTSGEVSLDITGSIDTDDGTGTANITARTTESGATTNETAIPCTLQAILDSDGNPAIAAGEARFTFECDYATTPLSAQITAVCKTLGAVSVTDCIED